MSLVRMIARPMLASVFVVHGWKNLRNPDQQLPAAKSFTDKVGPTLEKNAPNLPTDPKQLVRINAATQLGAGLALATGRFPRLAAAVLAVSLIPTTVAGHPFWESEDPEERNHHRNQAMKNAGLAGGLLLASVDTEGKPGLAWRAKHVAGRARKGTESAGKRAKKGTESAGKRAKKTAKSAKPSS